MFGGFYIWSYEEPTVTIEPSGHFYGYFDNWGPSRWRVAFHPESSYGHSRPEDVYNECHYTATVSLGSGASCKFSGSLFPGVASTGYLYYSTTYPISNTLSDFAGNPVSGTPSPDDSAYKFYPAGLYVEGHVPCLVVEPTCVLKSGGLVTVLTNKLDGSALSRGCLTINGPWSMPVTDDALPVCMNSRYGDSWTGTDPFGASNLVGTATVSNGVVIRHTGYGTRTLRPLALDGLGSVVYTQPPHLNYTDGSKIHAAYGDNSFVVSGSRYFHTIGYLSGAPLVTVYDESNVDYPSFLFYRHGGYTHMWSSAGVGSVVMSTVPAAEVTAITHTAIPYYPLNGIPHMPFVFSCPGHRYAGAELDTYFAEMSAAHVLVDASAASASGLKLDAVYPFTPRVFTSASSGGGIVNPYKYVYYDRSLNCVHDEEDFDISYHVSTVVSSDSHRSRFYFYLESSYHSINSGGLLYTTPDNTFTLEDVYASFPHCYSGFRGGYVDGASGAIQVSIVGNDKWSSRYCSSRYDGITNARLYSSMRITSTYLSDDVRSVRADIQRDIAVLSSGGVWENIPTAPSEWPTCAAVTTVPITKDAEIWGGRLVPANIRANAFHYIGSEGKRSGGSVHVVDKHLDSDGWHDNSPPDSPYKPVLVGGVTLPASIFHGYTSLPQIFPASMLPNGGVVHLISGSAPENRSLTNYYISCATNIHYAAGSNYSDGYQYGSHYSSAVIASGSGETHLYVGHTSRYSIDNMHLSGGSLFIWCIGEFVFSYDIYVGGSQSPIPEFSSSISGYYTPQQLNNLVTRYSSCAGILKSAFTAASQTIRSLEEAYSTFKENNLGTNPHHTGFDCGGYARKYTADLIDSGACVFLYQS